MLSRDLESLLDNLARSYLRGHVKNSPEGRAEIAAEIRQAVISGGSRAARKARRYSSPLRGGLPQELKRDYDNYLAAALDGL